MRSIKEILMDRDGMTAEDAEEQIESAKEALQEYFAEGREDLVEDVCAEYFGLEPDYLMELMPF